MANVGMYYAKKISVVAKMFLMLAKVMVIFYNCKQNANKNALGLSKSF